ncbi:MAG: ABC transporter substrate-binding protein [Candidatus Hodarchaeota archaeon]
MRKKNLIFVVCALALLTLGSMMYASTAAEEVHTFNWPSEFRPQGGYLDELVFVVYPSVDTAQALMALSTGGAQGLDAYDERVGPEFLPSLIGVKGVQINITQAMQYRQLSYNCQIFPTNITGFRRAIAFGADKYRAVLEAVAGAGSPLDSYIPVPAVEWEVESQMTTHFYDSDIAAGNASLEAAGFKDLDGDGWRDYDLNGDGDVLDEGESRITMNIGASAGWDPAIICAQVAMDGLHAMGIDGVVVEKDFSFLLDEFEAGGVNAVCFSWGIGKAGPPQSMFDFFHTGEVYSEMFYHLNNATIDAALDAMMAAETAEEAKEKSIIAVDMLAYEQPMLVMYNTAYTDAYRIDKWEGYFHNLGAGITNGDNNFAAVKVRLKEEHGGPYGGTYRYCFSEGWETTNPTVATERHSIMVFGYIYSGLYNLDPYTWDPIPDLAYNWTIEKTTEGGGLEAGQKFTFKLLENATWHDGKPVTSADVKFSMEGPYRVSPEYSPFIKNVYKIEAPDDHTVEIYTNKTGFFEFGRATGNFYILPKHVWETHGPDYDNWVPSTKAEMVGSGPFKWSTYVPGEYTALDRHADWHYSLYGEEAPDGDVPGFELLIGLISMVAVVSYFRKKKK